MLNRWKKQTATAIQVSEVESLQDLFLRTKGKNLYPSEENLRADGYDIDFNKWRRMGTTGNVTARDEPVLSEREDERSQVP